MGSSCEGRFVQDGALCRMTSTEAMASRCCWPPDGVKGLIGLLGQLGEAQHLVDARSHFGRRHAHVFQAEGDLLAHREASAGDLVEGLEKPVPPCRPVRPATIGDVDPGHSTVPDSLPR